MTILKVFLLGIYFSHTAYAMDFIPEASGICRVGKTLIIASDEEKNSVWISDDAGNMVKTRSQIGKWDDLEALTAVDAHTFFGVTSLALTKNAEHKEAREKIMLFSHYDGNIKVEKEWSFRQEVLNFLAREAKDVINLQEAMTAAPKEGGLNVEGATYQSGKLYLGLRSPLTKTGKAIILEIALNRDAFKVSGWRTVELNGNGIRDLSRNNNSLLILAGSSDITDKEFGLYSLKDSSLSRLNVPGFSDLMRPEGILKDEDGSLLFVQDFMTEQSQDFFQRLNHL